MTHRHPESTRTDTTLQVTKIAEITALFWLMKVVATTLGETLGDFVSMTLGLGYGVGIALTLGFFLAALAAQLLAKRYRPALFWLVIVGTTTLGTEISDFIDRSLHLGYAGGTALLGGSLFLVLFVWYRNIGSLEVSGISSRRTEVFFWSAVLFSNSLGTAFGDFLGDYLGMSFFQGALVTGGVILVVVLLHYYTRINRIVLFWIAFVFTRPFGATFGDLLTKPAESGGLHLGRLASSLVSVALMAVMIALEHRQLPRRLSTVG